MNSCFIQQDEEISIKNFLTDIKENKLPFRVIYARHLDLVSKPDAFPPGLENVMESILSEFSDCMNAHQVCLNNLMVTPYTALETSKQNMLLNKDLAARTYLVSDGKDFNKYFLMSRNFKIQSWVRFKDDKVFLMF